jgi:LysM repeat protein
VDGGSLALPDQPRRPSAAVRNVIPSIPQPERFEITVESERSLSNLAQRLGTTVDAIISDNGLAGAQLRPGMVLVITASRPLHEAFLAEREARKAALAAAKAAAAEKARQKARERRLARLKAQKEARSRRAQARKERALQRIRVRGLHPL